LQVGGDDAVAFLQGQLTNDVKLLSGANSHYSGYCTAKGRLLAIFLAFAHHNHFYLQLNGSIREPIAKRLKMYVLRSKVTIADVSDDIIRLGVSGAGTPGMLQQLFADVPQEPHQLVSLETANIIRLPGNVPRFEVFTTPEHAAEIWGKLRENCTAVGANCWNWLDIQAGIPDITPATQEAFVPQMVNLDAIGGISFKKGCYTGQEIVARTHYLGKVKRRTHLGHVDVSEPPPQAGDMVYSTDGTEPVGMVVSAALSPHTGFDLLAEIRLDNISGALSLTSPGNSAIQLRNPPYPLE
jgi:folate-binding protein YgfZ